MIFLLIVSFLIKMTTLPPFYLARRQANYDIQDLQNKDQAGLEAFVL